MHRLFSLALVALFAAGLAGSSGCGGSATKSPLDGADWILRGWSISSLYPGDFEITAKFAGGDVSGNAAVNSYGGPYSAGSSGDFSVGTLTRTLMAGPEPAMRAEDIYLQLLGEARAYRLDAAGLTLLDANGNELLIFGSADGT